VSVPVLFVLLPNVLMLDLAGPAEVLRLAAQAEDGAGIDFDQALLVARMGRLKKLEAAHS